MRIILAAVAGLLVQPRRKRMTAVSRLWLVGLLSLAAMAARPVSAATIEVFDNQRNGLTVIAIAGELLLGDEEKFKDKVFRVRKGLVMLAGPGGNLFAGLEIGKAVRLKGFATLVPGGMECASSCAYAWLGGRPRLAAPDAMIGFHAASRLQNGRVIETGPGNALIGSYLHSLGFSDEAIYELTSTSPEDIKWLTSKEAEGLGIDVKNFQLPSGETRTARSDPAPQQDPRRSPPNTSVSRPQAPSSAAHPVTPVPDAVFLDADVSSSTPTAPQRTDLTPPKVAVLTPPPDVKPSGPGVLAPPRPELQPQLLDLAHIESAAQVQRRLHQRGYFSGVVDGVWGPRSRIALRDFKVNNGFGSDDEWNARVQLALFDDRYRVAALGYVAPDPNTPTTGLFRPFAPTNGATLHSRAS